MEVQVKRIGGFFLKEVINTLAGIESR